MTPWRLIIREILHRKLDFALGALAVLIAVTALVAVIEVLDRHDHNTGAILARVQGAAEQRVAAKRVEADRRVADAQARLTRDLEIEQAEATLEVQKQEVAAAREVARNEVEVAAEVAKLEDDIRKITTQMGFNIYILPKRPASDSLLPDDEKPAYMPEEYVTRLANSTVITVRHLLPLLECRTEWPEQDGRQFILVGMRGEVPLVNRTPKTPIAPPIADGTIVLGYKVWNRLKLKVGQTVTLMGHKFTVAACYPERDMKNDSRVWVPLDKAQEMLHAKGLIPKKKVISAIWALECSCAWRDLDKVRAEIYRILPGTDIKGDYVKALARAEARKKVEEDGKARIERVKAGGLARIDRTKGDGLARIDRVRTRGRNAVEQARRDGAEQVARVTREGREELRHQRDSRARLQGQLEMLMMVVIPVSIAGSAAWVGLMAYGSVRRRRREIGILRAIGMRAGQVTMVLLVRAVLLGLLGAVAGWGAGLLVSSRFAEAPEAAARAGGLGVAAMLVIILAAPVLTALATVIPAAIAGRQDPATVLQEE